MQRKLAPRFLEHIHPFRRLQCTRERVNPAGIIRHPIVALPEEELAVGAEQRAAQAHRVGQRIGPVLIGQGHIVQICA